MLEHGLGAARQASERRRAPAYIRGHVGCVERCGETAARQFEPCGARSGPVQPVEAAGIATRPDGFRDTSGSKKAARKTRRRVMPMTRTIDYVQSPTTRRKFLAGAGVTGAAAIAMPQVSRAQTATLKMQGSWGAKDVFNEMAQDYVKRVNDMAGGRLKIDYLVGGAVVHPFQVLDGVHGGQIDARPYRDRLLVRQAQGGLAVRHRPGVRLQRQRGSRLDPQRRRQGAVRRAADPDHEAQRQELLRDADADPAARLVQEADRPRPTTSRA